ncbi:hypothetical protein AKJ55_00575 [candidate division MSBL1 archaeon SCGC-AAA382M17]|uniref:CARDB domain-containing protein n=1 Tax=candidate division MSBL1 archaeon SCGC-AAA382M17 TaxID=1698284 RepID=A0ABR5TJX4_9EURY|nr:hypothetical protein AKJ55_00575 [candidate division MSBL1 archaeon SCGC-AAA382M17]
MSFKNILGRKYLILVVVVIVGVAGVALYFRFSFTPDNTGDHPEFVVNDVVVGVRKAEIGENVPVRVTLSNTGGAGGTHLISLYADNQKEDSERVSLAAGESSEVLLFLSPSEPDNYQVRVDDLELGSVRFYVVEPLEPRDPLTWVNWSLDFLTDSNNENAPVDLHISASASSGIKVELYRIRNGGLNLIKEEWWTETEVSDRELTAVIGRGSPESQTLALIVKGPSGEDLYRGCKEYKEGKAEVKSVSLYRAVEGEEYRYALGKVKGEIQGDLPVFVARVKVSIDGEPVDAGLSKKGYVVRGYFPSVLIYSEVKKGSHQIEVSFFDEKGREVCSFGGTKIFG